MIDSKEILEEGIPVNGILEINTPDDKYVAPDATEWLKTGVVETDVASYPDATSVFEITGVNYSGDSFDMSNELTVATGACWDGAHFWVVGRVSGSVYQYTTSGVYTGVSFSVTTLPYGITWDGTHFWVPDDSTNAVHQYTAAGVTTGFSFSLVNEDHVPKGIAWDGAHLWVIGTNTDTAHQYTTSGVYTGVSFSVASETTSPSGIEWDGTHFWVTSSTSMFQYTLLGEYTGFSFSLAGQTNSAGGLAWYGSGFLVVDGSTIFSYKYNADGFDYIGVQTPSTGAAGLPNYTRIK